MSSLQSSPFFLNKAKAVEAAGVLLQCAPNRQMTRLRLLKLLYIADRESFKEKGRPITGDRVAAMDHGPVLSGIYDMIKNSHPDPGQWPQFIATNHNDVILSNNPGVGELSRWEVNRLQEIWTRYEDKSEWYIVHEVVHRFQEYINYRPSAGSSRTIPHGDLLLAVGLTADEVEQIFAAANEEIKLDAFWDRVSA